MTARSLLAPALLLVLAACSSTKGESFLAPGYDLSGIRRIAIVDSKEGGYKPETRQAIVDSFQMEFLRKGWSVVERANLQKAVDELNLQNSDLTSSADRNAIGNVLNVQGLVIVNLATKDDELSLTAKMVAVDTGELIWMGSGDAALNSKTSMLAGALAGAAVGAAAGKNMGDHGGEGAIVGAIAGGAVGSSMTPTQMENAKKLVKVIAEAIPAR